MLSTDEIKKLYLQFQNDISIDIELPELLIIPKSDIKGMAQVGKKISNLIELFIGDKFSNKKINKKYLAIVLYHEFAHIYDNIIFFEDVTDPKEHQNLLFPYTEFHAAQIEMKKRLELFHNPQKQISLSTKVYDEKGIISLKEYLNIQFEQFNIRYKRMDDDPSIENIHNVVYLIIYNIGYYSICSKYNIDKSLFIPNNYIDYIENDNTKISNLLIGTTIPSDDLCLNVNQIMRDLLNKIAQNYGV